MTCLADTTMSQAQVLTCLPADFRKGCARLRMVAPHEGLELVLADRAVQVQPFGSSTDELARAFPMLIRVVVLLLSQTRVIRGEAERADSSRSSSRS